MGDLSDFDEDGRFLFAVSACDTDGGFKANIFVVVASSDGFETAVIGSASGKNRWGEEHDILVAGSKNL